MSGLLNESFELPCGVKLQNRLCKAAMTERMSDAGCNPTELHCELYRRFARTGAGLQITGNVLVDEVHLESRGNVIMDESSSKEALKSWASAAKSPDNQVWVQLNYAGRQTNRFHTQKPLAPSSIQLKKLGLFGRPKAMTEHEIMKVIQQFVYAAKLCQEVGFTGIQIHAAHGYLLSQFLSPKTNIRHDKWGGSIENRARILIEIVKLVRKSVGPSYPISVKLNSADFLRGGFSEDDSLEVIKMLDALAIDLLEISGGTYERLAFFEAGFETKKDSTVKREAYFIDFARRIRQVSDIPLMITGGFRTRTFCEEVLASGELDIIGMGRPFITNLDDISDFLAGSIDHLDARIIKSGFKALDDVAEGGYYAKQLIRIAKGKKIQNNLGGISSAIFFLLHEMRPRFLFKRK